MRYIVEVLSPARKALRNIDSRYIEKIMERIELLETDPRHHGSLKLTGIEDAYRTRVGKYRILYKIFDKKVYVTVVNIDHRKDVYR